ncbi:MAG TPA: methyltransferase domain-containing protein [Candidatus Thermoplasmatota archaeon]
MRGTGVGADASNLLLPKPASPGSKQPRRVDVPAMKNRRTPRISGLPELRLLADRSVSAVDLHLGPLRRVPTSVWLPEVQRALKPGGFAHIVLQNASGAEIRSLMREASHYFDAERTGSGSFLITRRPTAATAAHFEELAGHYWSQIPIHIQEHFLNRKLELLRDLVQPLDGTVGLDLGCGVGRFAAELRRRYGANVVGVDPSRAAIREARQHDALGVFASADALRLPFADESFDYAYTINVLHHLKRGEQERALAELHRVMKPGAVLIVHEMNIRNPLFAWYLRRLYPRIRPIDKGDEEFIHPDSWPLAPGWKRETTRYMTFVPDFLPQALLPPARKIEAFLENGRAGPFSAHYVVALRKV